MDEEFSGASSCAVSAAWMNSPNANAATAATQSHSTNTLPIAESIRYLQSYAKSLGRLLALTAALPVITVPDGKLPNHTG